jgi:chorismate synthase
MLILNRDAKGSDYKNTSDLFRPGHADFSFFKKYGLPPQPGGGRSSGRETVSRVAAGAAARVLLKPLGIAVRGASSAIGPVRAAGRDFGFAETNPLRFLDEGLLAEAEEAVARAMRVGDSLGSVVELEALGVPAGLGEPVFDKLEARLGAGFFSIGAVKAVEFGEAIALSSLRGTGANAPFGPDGPEANPHGGILGGISTGQTVAARLFVKPTPSVSAEQRTVNLRGERATISVGGRHDPCLAPRVAPVAEAMCLITLADFLLGPPSRMEDFLRIHSS